MRDVRLTVKNYRSFDDGNPLVIEIGRGFTALVGANNSGKSSFLKFFFEFRNLWQSLYYNLVSYLQDAQHQQPEIGLNAIPDPDEIFSNTNERDLTIEICVQGDLSRGKTTEALQTVICTCKRGNPLRFSFRFISNANNRELVRGKSAQWSQQYHSIVDGKGLVCDTTDFCEVVRCFYSALYIGPFRNAINEGGGNYYDLSIGESFIQLWDSWKTGTQKIQNRAIEGVTSDIRQIFGYEKLEINAAQSQKTLALVADGKPYRLSELGAGLSQFIIVLGNAAIRKPPLILVDEPELSLHPSLQIDFLTSLGSYASEGIIFATHSIGLARSTARHIYTFQKKSGTSVVRPFEQTENYLEFVGELSFSTFRDLGHDRILLVEGVNDVKTVQQFLRMKRKDHEVVLIPLGGNQLARGGIEQELSELFRISKNISAFVDSERESEKGAPKKERAAFQDVCNKLQINLCLTTRRAIENYFTDAAVKSVFGDKYSSLSPYESLKSRENGWSKTDNWRIARQMSFTDIEGTDVGRFLSNL